MSKFKEFGIKVVITSVVLLLFNCQNHYVTVQWETTNYHVALMPLEFCMWFYTVGVAIETSDFDIE